MLYEVITGDPPLAGQLQGVAEGRPGERLGIGVAQFGVRVVSYNFV